MVGGNLKKVAVTQIPFKPKLVDPKIIFHRGNHTTTIMVVPYYICYQRKQLCLPMKGFILVSLVVLLCGCISMCWRSSFTLKVVPAAAFLWVCIVLLLAKTTHTQSNQEERKRSCQEKERRWFGVAWRIGCEMGENGGIFRIICELKR